MKHSSTWNANTAALSRTLVNRVEILPLVQTDLDARIAKGAEQYGERLTSHNGRDALWDAYEEALDLCMYLRQAIAERDSR